MRVMIDDLEVLWPYDYIYPEQYNYMCKLYQSLQSGHCLLEMPTGTGKSEQRSRHPAPPTALHPPSCASCTSHPLSICCLLYATCWRGRTVSLLSLILSYQYHKQQGKGKLVYWSVSSAATLRFTAAFLRIPSAVLFSPVLALF